MRRKPKAVCRALRPKVARAAARAREILGWETCLLSLLLLFVTVWLVAAGVLLPPRGIDDLVYHLPPIYQSVQEHRIVLLPVQLRDMFASPLDGELLFLWPLIFFHADSLIDLVQLAVALYGILVVYAMARRFDVSPRNAAFAACLFLFTPVVLGQAGSNYVDLITGVLYLVLLFAAVRFHETGAFLDLAIAGVATGFAAGAKYSMLVFVAAFQPLLWLRWRRGLTPGRYAAYLLLALPLSAYWPLRNFLRTGHPFYPLMPSLSGFRLVPESTSAQITRAAPSVLADFLAHPAQALSYPFRDPGLGSFHGGFGVVFWGLGAPAILCCLGKALRAAFRERCFFPLAFWGQVLVAAAAFAVLPRRRARLHSALRSVRARPRAVGARHHLSPARRGPARVGRRPEGLLHRRRRPGGHPPRHLSMAVLSDRGSGGRLEPGPAHVRVHVPATGRLGSAEPESRLGSARLPDALGTRLERLHGVRVVRVLDRAVLRQPPAESNLELRAKSRRAAGRVPLPLRPSRPAALLRRTEITPQEVLRDQRYALVAQTPYTTLWVRRRLLDEPPVSERLAEYYARTFAPVVRTAEQIAPLLGHDGVVITASDLGYGLRYLSLTHRLTTPVYLVPADQEATLAARLGARKVFTVGVALPGFVSRPIALLAQPNGKVAIYENTRS